MIFHRQQIMELHVFVIVSLFTVMEIGEAVSDN